MKRITVSLPDDVAELLDGEAYRRRSSVSAIVREAVEKELGVHPECGPKRVPFAGIASSGKRDLSTRFDEYLAAAIADRERRKRGMLDRDRDC